MPSKVLLMDGNESDRRTVGTWLEENGYMVGYAMDVAGVAELAQVGAYDIVIADLQWPCLDGATRLSRLKELLPGAVIFAVSDFSDRELEEEARRQGAVACLTKPLNLEELKQALDAKPTPEGISQGRAILPGKQLEQTLLRGFNPDDQWDFRQIGNLKAYSEGESLLLTEETNSLLWVEQGKLGVYINGALVDLIGEGEFWGEETFVGTFCPFVQLRAQNEARIRHFSRKRIIEFFAWHDEKLTKRYMINLILCLQLKWKRSLNRLAKNGIPSFREPQGT